MLSAIPQPAIPGRVIGLVSSVDDRAISVYWNDGLKKVVFNYGRQWLMSEDDTTIDTISSIFNIEKTELVISSFRLLEHGREITKNSDLDNFSECYWSDYSRDNMCVGVEFDYARSGSTPRGGE